MVLALLPKLRLNRHFPRAIVYAPKRIGGLGITPFYVLHGYECMKYIINQIRHNTPRAKLINISLQLLHLECGQRKVPLQYHPIPSYVPNKIWTASLWRFIDYVNIEISLSLPTEIPLQRNGDAYIMDLPMKTYTVTQLKKINSCRIYLKALCISDITNLCGTQITRAAWEGTKKCISKLQWPEQIKPPKQSWRLWRSFLTYGLTITNKELLTPLGEWLPGERHVRHTFLWSHENDTLYSQTEDRIMAYTRSTTERRHKYNFNGIRQTQIPTSAIPVGVSNGLQISSQLPRIHQRQNVVVSDTTLSFETLLRQLPMSLRDVVGQISLPCDNLQTLRNKLSEGSLQIASDVSVKESRGSYGYKFKTQEKENHVTGFGKCPHHHESISSLAAEARGALAVAIILNCLYRSFKDPPVDASFTVYIDNETTINRINTILTEKQLPDPMIPEYDTFAQIEQLIGEYKFGNWQWVRGHQKESLDPIAILNKEVDVLAKEGWESEMNTPKACRLPVSKIHICRGDQLISSNLKPILHLFATQDKYIDYVTTKHRWTKHTYENISWRSYMGAFKKMKLADQLLMTKLRHRWQNTGVQKERIDGLSNECPTCQSERETSTHFLKCRKQIQQQAWKSLRAELVRVHTVPPILASIKNIIFGYEYTTVTDINPIDKNIHSTIKLQETIGLDNFILGYISKSWYSTHKHLSTYFKTKLVNRSVWESVLLKAVWKYCCCLWENRNALLHANEQNGSISRCQLVTKVSDMYKKYQFHILQRDQYLFNSTIETLTEHTSTTLKKWIALVHTAVNNFDTSFGPPMTQMLITTYMD